MTIINYISNDDYKIILRRRNG